MANGRPPRFLDGDRRESNYWLRDALELALYEWFCATEEALILHGRRHSGTGHGPFANFALLDADCKLILVKIERGRLTRSAAQRAVSQFENYVATYRSLTLQEHATWYCRHGVDVAVWFEYRGPGFLHKNGQAYYGRLNMARPRCFEHYLAGDSDPARALEILREDHDRIVRVKALDELSGDSRLEVGRCILIAECWPSGFQAAPGGVQLELWRSRPPVDWIHP